MKADILYWVEHFSERMGDLYSAVRTYVLQSDAPTALQTGIKLNNGTCAPGIWHGARTAALVGENPASSEIKAFPAKRYLRSQAANYLYSQWVPATKSNLQTLVVISFPSGLTCVPRGAWRGSAHIRSSRLEYRVGWLVSLRRAGSARHVSAGPALRRTRVCGESRDDSRRPPRGVAVSAPPRGNTHRN